MAVRSDSPIDTIMEDAYPPRDPYEGRREFYQRKEECVRDFVRRLPPSSTDTSVVGPFIFVSNPHIRRKVTSPDIRGFKVDGQALLEGFENREATLKSEGVTKTKLKENINAERQKLEADVLECARKNGIHEGKWMLFVSARQVDEVWKAVVSATMKGNLGIQAKVAVKNDGDHRPRLIAIYTHDFADKEDIKKVLVKLVDMGLVVNQYASKGQIYYKCDAHTYLDIFAKNKWGISPSMHSSGEILRKGF